MIGDDRCDLLVPEGTGSPGGTPCGARSWRRSGGSASRRGTVCHDWLVRTLRAAGYEPDIRHQAEENHTQLALVAAGLGVAMIPRLGRGPLPAGVVAVRLDPVPVRRLYALWRTEAARRPAITAAVTALQGRGARVGLA